MASDRTSQTGEATAGFVQRPTIPPRSRRVISHSPLEIAAEYRAIVSRQRKRWRDSLRTARLFVGKSIYILERTVGV